MPTVTPSTKFKPTILIVEDEESIRVILRTVLEQHGHRVLAVGDAEEALRLSAQHAGPIDLLITDMILPGMHGGDLVRRLVPTRPELHVLYISGFTEETSLPSAPEGKMVYLAKPFTPAQLLQAVTMLMET
jgi:CheY-like chemotaxis protein